MISDHFQRELNMFRERGKAFARLHPALAPMLAEEGADPDVERLLEGAAYMSAAIREKLDDELPEIIHSLLNMVAPHYLRPLPSATIMAFTPRRALRECLTIPRGTLINSVEVDGCACPFATCADVDIAPLQVTGVETIPGRSGRAVVILRFATLSHLPLDGLKLKRLRFYFAGAYADAALRLMTLRHHCTSLHLVPEAAPGSAPMTLAPNALRMTGFDEDDALIPYPAASFPGFRYLQEFFMMPERFCQLELAGFETWTTRGRGETFSLEFELEGLSDTPPAFRSEHIHLFAVPAINIFPMSGDPIRLDHRRDQYIIRPAGSGMKHYLVYSVDHVTGLRQGENEPREYQPFMAANPGSSPLPVYTLSTRLDEGAGLLVQLSVGRMQNTVPEPELHSQDLHCTNGRLPEKLHAGDICHPTDTSPELADFTNLRPPTASSLPPLGGSTLWRLLSHLFLNYLSVASTENLRSMLKVYIFGKSGDNSSQVAHIARVDGIEDLRVQPVQRLVRGQLMRGQEVSLMLRRENFAGDGDMYIFSAMLSAFLSSYAAVNTFTVLRVRDSSSRLVISWPARPGSRPLL